MITRYLASVTTKFNPFTPGAKTARVFLANLPPNARQNMQINTTVLPRASVEPATLDIKFKDGKEMTIDLEKMKINDVAVEVDRHSRMLQRQEDLSNS
ncbi:mitochondrial ribosomal protein L44 [Trichodelitschia bisporula]|uniref:Large ribosomal subunit protein mL53 n=1 Tax=Trichodelitschia bisporula TaxID=703511 RepID=A0A6G1I706_9PEZI|nr:mitochondrial ribosomal protein L44 [Trichodelitschia bisporula]